MSKRAPGRCYICRHTSAKHHRHFRGHSVSEIHKIVGPEHDTNAHMRILQGSSWLPEASERLQTLDHWSRTGWIHLSLAPHSSQRGQHSLTPVRQVLESSSKVLYVSSRISGRRCVVTERLQRGPRKYLHGISCTKASAKSSNHIHTF